MPDLLALFSDRPVRGRIAQVRSDLAEWLQHEPAFPHPGMWQLETLVPPPEVAEQQQIEIQRAGCVRSGAHAAGPALDVEQDVQQFQWLQPVRAATAMFRHHQGTGESPGSDSQTDEAAISSHPAAHRPSMPARSQAGRSPRLLPRPM